MVLDFNYCTFIIIFLISSNSVKICCYSVNISIKYKQFQQMIIIFMMTFFPLNIKFCSLCSPSPLLYPSIPQRELRWWLSLITHSQRSVYSSICIHMYILVTVCACINYSFTAKVEFSARAKKGNALLPSPVVHIIPIYFQNHLS